MRINKSMCMGAVFGAIFTMALGVAVPALAKTGAESISVAYRNIRIFVDGTEKQPSAEPFVYNGSTFVPLRFVSDALGKEIQWDESANSIYIGKPPTNAPAPAAASAAPKPSQAPTVEKAEKGDYSGTYLQAERTKSPYYEQNQHYETQHRFFLKKTTGNTYEVTYNVDEFQMGQFWRLSESEVPFFVELVNGKGECKNSAGYVLFTIAFQPDGSFIITGGSEMVKNGGTVDGKYVKQ